MTRLADIQRIASTEHMFVSGLLHTEPQDNLPPQFQTLVLLSPDEPAFWAYFNSSEEKLDGQPDPLDRWTVKAMGRMTSRIGGGVTALLPFGGPPWRPFIDWAKRSGRARVSPVGLLVHDSAGLFISYRAALALPERLDLPALYEADPCEKCHRPCLNACPVDAFSSGSYDVPSCKSHLSLPQGRPCRTSGCQVRRACPIGKDRRLPEQSAFHMKAFHPHDT